MAPLDLATAENAPAVGAQPGRRLWSRGITYLRQHPGASFGLGLLLAFTVIAVIAPLVEPYSAVMQSGPVYSAPSARHLLGTDDGGVDILSLLLQGTRISMLVGFCGSFVSVVIGGGIGLLAGYFGGPVDSALSRIIEVFLSIPVVPLMIALAAIWGPSLFHIILVIGLLLWMTTARVIRAQVKSVRERGYVRRAQSVGCRHMRVLWRHVLPHVSPLLVANAVLTVALAIFYETALDFLGLGDPSAVSWGTIIEHAFLRTAISNGAWWAFVPAGVCVALVVIACFQVGSAIEDAFKPRLRASHLIVRSWGSARVLRKEADIDSA
jgi:peptide/nickel transport system permease protein